MVVLGRASKPEIELNADACVEDGVPILRRRGGGCAVVIDPGNAIVAVAMPAKGIGGITEHFSRLSAWVIAGLERAGVIGVYHDGISDLVCDDLKIGGACIYRAKDLLLYSATLLVDPDLDLVERYLKHPPREPEYRRGRSHREFMGGIGVLLPDDIEPLLRLTLRSETPEWDADDAEEARIAADRKGLEHE